MFSNFPKHAPEHPMFENIEADGHSSASAWEQHGKGNGLFTQWFKIKQNSN